LAPVRVDVDGDRRPTEGWRRSADYCLIWNGDLRRTVIPLRGFCADHVYP